MNARPGGAVTIYKVLKFSIADYPMCSYGCKIYEMGNVRFNNASVQMPIIDRCLFKTRYINNNYCCSVCKVFRSFDQDESKRKYIIFSLRRSFLFSISSL